ncbi:hypothetical protein ACWGS9_07430 [Bradyrhizobium sp. Arg314]
MIDAVFAIIRGIDLSAVAIMAMSVAWYLQLLNTGTSDGLALGCMRQCTRVLAALRQLAESSVPSSSTGGARSEATRADPRILCVVSS